MTKSRWRFLATAVSLTALVSPVAAAQQGPFHFAYIIGADTVGTETVRLDETGIGGTLTMRGQPRIEWRHTTEHDRPLTLTLALFAPGAATESAPVQRFAFTPRHDSMVVQITAANGTTRTEVAATTAGAHPLMGQSLAHWAFMTHVARTTNRLAFPAFLTSGGRTVDASVRVSGDTTELRVVGLTAQVVWADGAPREIRVPAQQLRVVRTSGAPPALTAVTVNYDAPADAPYTHEHVSIGTPRGYTLAGTLTTPKGATRPLPVVITISGSGPQDRDSRLAGIRHYAPFREIADTLGRRGIAVLRFDDRGVGESGGATSRDSATSEDFADDVLSVVEFLRRRRDIDGARIAVAGHSEGGLIAPIAAVKDPRVRAVVLLAGTAYNGRRILEFQNEAAIRSTPNLSAAQRDSLRRAVPGVLDSLARTNRWMRWFMTTDPLETVRRVKQPVLILQGDTDQQVTPEQADTLAATLRRAGNRAVAIHRFPATNHLLLADDDGSPARYPMLGDTRVRREVLGTLADWLATVLR